MAGEEQAVDLRGVAGKTDQQVAGVGPGLSTRLVEIYLVGPQTGKTPDEVVSQRPFPAGRGADLTEFGKG